MTQAASLSRSDDGCAAIAAMNYPKEAIGVVVAAWLLGAGIVRARGMMVACDVVLPNRHVGRAGKNRRTSTKRQRQAEDQRGHQDL